MIYFIIIMIRENDNNNKEYCNCEIAEQLQISEDINNMTDKKNGREYLGYVLEKLKERITEISLSLVEGQKEIEGMHEYYWENYTEMDQYGYENYDNQQALFRQISANEEQLILKQRFRRMADSPFFGRVDFIYEGEDEPEIFYIGIGNFAEKAGHIPLVYDWRAPVSGLFYDYDKGPASYEAPMGEKQTAGSGTCQIFSDHGIQSKAGKRFLRQKDLTPGILLDFFQNLQILPHLLLVDHIAGSLQLINLHWLSRPLPVQDLRRLSMEVPICSVLPYMDPDQILPH